MHTLILSFTISFYVGPLLSPSNLHISIADFVSREIVFRWSPDDPDCPIDYNILSSNCGSCPTTTNNTNVTCTDVPIDGSTCTFAVQSVVCGNLSANVSDSINVTAPNIREMAKCKGTSVDSNSPNQQIPCTEIVTNPVTDNSRIVTITFIASIVLATLFTVWVVISTLIIIMLLKFRRKGVRTIVTRASTTRSHNVDPQTVFDTSDNIAYGMITAGGRRS